MGRKIPNEKQISAQDNFYKYNPNIKATARESPRFSFGSAKRNQKENVP